MDQYFDTLTTETVNPDTLHIDECDALGIVTQINRQDALVAAAVEKELPRVAEAVDILYAALHGGGRMFYVGAGTSGRLGVLDASECQPTYGIDPQLVQGHIAGGDYALRNAVEGSEDDREAGARLIRECGITAKDAVVGITASGSAPFVLAAVAQAKQLGAATVGVVNNRGTRLSQIADVTIAPVVGPEAVMGSTRMKSGTAQKMVLNMLSTAVMIKLGKVYNNLMVDMIASNAKLRDRSVRIVREATGVPTQQAQQLLQQADGSVKSAIFMQKTQLSSADAERYIARADGRLKQAIALAEEEH